MLFSPLQGIPGLETLVSPAIPPMISIDPCLYVRKSAKGIIYVALYVDDSLMIGNMATIDDAIEC